MTKRRPLILLVVLTLLTVTGACGFRWWRAQRAVLRELQALARAQSLLKRGHPEDALSLVDNYSIGSKDPAWFAVQLQAVTKIPDLARLALLFDRFPAEVLKDEDASTLLARGFLQEQMRTEFERVRAAWRGREVQKEVWRLLDADLLLLTGQQRQAEKLLSGSEVTSAADAPRLVRLALVIADRDPAGACKLLDQAVALQPTNSMARWSRGEILERMGRLRLARVEYASALATTPANPYWRDQLAEFYVRCHNHDVALQTWAEDSAKPSPDFIQLKLQFFHRVLRPAPAGSTVATAEGELEPLVRLIDRVPAGHFFDTNAFSRLPGATTFAAQRPEVYWLRLLEALQTGSEADALDLLLTGTPRLQSWDPDLAGALARVLHFRRKQSLNPPGIAFKTTWGETNRPPFFALLERAARDEQAAPDHKAKLPPEFSAVLRGSNIFSQLLLTAGWREAALQLRRSPRVEPGEPDALGAAYAEALSLNRNARAALDFLGTGPLPPAAVLVRGELLLEVGRHDEALVQLRALAKLNSPGGVRASSLLALDAMEKKDYPLARQTVAEQPLLAQSDLGKELLARVALADNRLPEAEQIYRGIMKTSIEAKTWLAQKAFKEHKWQEARQIVNESLDLIPDSPQLRESLAAIDKAEAAEKKPARL